MSDVSNNAPLTSPLEVNPAFPLLAKCIRKAYITFHNNLKTDVAKKTEIVFGSDFFIEEYTEFLNVVDDSTNALYQFKKILFRALSCQIKSFSLVTPMNGKSYLNVCHSQGCPNCGPYQAVERLNHIKNMIRYTTFTDTNLAKEMFKEVKETIAVKNWTWLTVTLTPFYTGGGMLRIGNLMPHLDNPLTDDTSVIDSIAEFDKIFGFDKVTKLSSEGTEITYLTGTGITFTSTNLYHMRNSGRKGSNIREMGTAKGLEFNAETGKIEYKSESQRKEEEQEKAGVIEKKNVPGIAVDSVPRDVLKHTLIRAGRKASLYRERMVLPIDTPKGMAIQSVKIMHDWRDQLEASGFAQPDHFNAVKITKEDYDKFIKHTITPVTIPDNIMSIKFELPENDGKLTYWIQYARTHDLIRAQKAIIAAPTIEEWADEILQTLLE